MANEVRSFANCNGSQPVNQWYKDKGVCGDDAGIAFWIHSINQVGDVKAKQTFNNDIDRDLGGLGGPSGWHRAGCAVQPSYQIYYRVQNPTSNPLCVLE